MRKIPLRKISSFFFPKPNNILREISSNASMLDWSAKNTTEHVFHDKFEFYEYIYSDILNSDNIDFIEFGVFKGTSLFKWAEINNNADSRFYGFDSFEGLPEVWDSVSNPLPKKQFDVSGRIPETNDKRIQFIKGIFQDTLRPFLKNYTPQNRLVIHNDSDIYSSTLYCLTMLDEILVKGSLLIFDEFYSSSHEFQAFFDYYRAYRKNVKVLASVGENPYIQVAMMLE